MSPARLGPALLLCLAPTISPAQDAGARLKTTLDRLNATSERFTSAQASFHKDLYNSLVKEHTPQDGMIYFLRVKSAGKAAGIQMGAKIVGAGARTVEYKNGTLRDFNPGINCYDTVNASGNQARVESFLTLGFGGSGTDLAKSWEITDLGGDKLDGVPVEKLDLLPRDASVKGLVMHVTLWLDLDRGVSLKQVFYAPSGDEQTATYSNIETRKKPDLKAFEIKGNACGK